MAQTYAYLRNVPTLSDAMLQKVNGTRRTDEDEAEISAAISEIRNQIRALRPRRQVQAEPWTAPVVKLEQGLLDRLEDTW